MAERPVLSVDTSSDDSSAWFAMVRAEVYRPFAGVIGIDRLGGGVVDRAHLMSAVRSAAARGRPYSAITFAAHGSPGVVHDAHGGVLFSENDALADLATLFKDRLVYLCCCRSMSGQLPDKLLEAGACAAIGFTGEPSWEGDAGRRIWADFDGEISRCILERKGFEAITATQAAFLERIEQTFPNADETFQGDLAAMQEVLRTMVIRSREER